MTNDPRYYDVLELSPNANARDIKKAYRRLALRYHPDHNPGDSAAEKSFRDVAGAYEILGNPLKRHHYDQSRAQGAPQPASAATPPPRREYTRRERMPVIQESLLSIPGVPLMLALGFYALALLYEGPSAVHAIVLLAAVLCIWWPPARDTLVDFAFGLSALRCNLLWTIVSIFVLKHVYAPMYFKVFAVPLSGYGVLDVFMALFRFLFFISWMLTYPGLRIFMALGMLATAVPLVRQQYALAGWVFFAFQIALATLIRLDTHAVHDFTVWYESLFSIDPLKPRA